MSRYFSKLAERTGLNSAGRNFSAKVNPAHVPLEMSRSAKGGSSHEDLAVISEVRTIPSVTENEISRRDRNVVTGPPGSISALAGREQRSQAVRLESFFEFRPAVHRAENECLSADMKKEKGGLSPVVMGEKREFTDRENIDTGPARGDKQLYSDDSAGPHGFEESSQTFAFSTQSGASQSDPVSASEFRKIDKQEIVKPSDTLLGKSLVQSLEGLVQDADSSAPEVKESAGEVFEKGDPYRGHSSPGLSDGRPIRQMSKRTAVLQNSVSDEKNSTSASEDKRESVEIKIGTISMEVFQAAQPKPEPQFLMPSPVVKKNKEQPTSSRLHRFYLKGW